LAAVVLFDGPIYDRRSTQKPALTIMALDVVGYSRLMERDESGTLAMLTEHRTERLN
jgi:class 3 adenylate cyclase